MNNNIKVICGTIVGFVLGGATIVCANQAIQAMQNTEIKVSLNGQIQEFKDEKTGETQYPITYNSRTYLPLRNVAELAGMNVEYDSNTKTASLKSTSSNNVFSSEDLMAQEKIRYKIAKELDEKRPDFYNGHYFETIAKVDINNDGQGEYILLITPDSEAFNLRIFSTDGEELKDGLEKLDQVVDGLEVRKENDKYVLFVETSFGDGLCYENNNIYEVKLVDNKFQVRLLGRYVCDQEEEEKKRAAMVHEDGSEPTLEELAVAHTLRYIVNDEIVTKEEYNKAIQDYKNTHELVNKIK